MFMAPGLSLFPLAVGVWRLADPLWFLALLAIPVVFWLRRRARVDVLVVPYASAWHRPAMLAASRWPLWLGAAGLALIVLGLARPQRVEDQHDSHNQGYDIMLCIDLSSSMLSEDYEKNGEPMNRLQAVKPVIQAFIEQRPDDRIGVVLFSAHAYTLAPLTSDHDWLARQLERVNIGLIQDGTAIGDGLGVALSRLDQAAREQQGRRQGAFIVLLTDGANNMGALAPMQAAAIARARAIPIYTIGAGKDGIVRFPVFNDQHQKIGYTHIMADLDESALREISATTGGHFFRAADTDTIESAFQAIDQAQKIEFQTKSTLLTTELFPWFAVPGLASLVLAALLVRRAPRAAIPPLLPAAAAPRGARP
jgi:Ca-activated chloride channel family protein